jgi:hypothetical protein
MALLSEATKEKEFDLRTVDRALAKGLMNRDQLTKHIKSLPDDSEFVDSINTEELMEGIEGKSPLRK